MGPRDVVLFEGGTPGCQDSLTHKKETEAFLMPQAPRFMLTSSWCDWSCWIPQPRWKWSSKSQFIFSILSQSVNSLFCVNEHLACSSPARCPVTLQWFSGSEWCTRPDKARWGSLWGFPIKAGHSHGDRGIWLSLKEERFKWNKWIIGTFCAECSDFWVELGDVPVENIGPPRLADHFNLYFSGKHQFEHAALINAPLQRPCVFLTVSSRVEVRLDTSTDSWQRKDCLHV